MIYFIVTTCIFEDSPIRMYQYIHGITKLAEVVQNTQFSDYKIVVIENNGARYTYFDDLVEGCKKSRRSNSTWPIPKTIWPDTRKDIANYRMSLTSFRITKSPTRISL
jgi:hypothetical protein